MSNGKTLTERVLGELRGLYPKYGYTLYRMNGFEEYDLYAGNRDFLRSGQIITFTGADGRLMAMRPDVTMSIIKDSGDEPGRVDKYFYSENVYRVPPHGGEFREIVQTGLECIGDIGDYDRAEVVSLAADSLCRVSDEYVLDISHMGYVSAVLDAAELDAAGREAAVTAVGAKNLGALRCIADEAECRPEVREVLTGLVGICGELGKAAERLAATCINDDTRDAVEKLRRLASALPDRCRHSVHLDFSVVHDMNYYDGLVFSGYVPGIPEALLRGGEYGRLMRKIGRGGSAVGFAVYTDLIDTLDRTSVVCDADVMLVAGDDADPRELRAEVERLIAGGESVLVQRTDAGSARCVRLEYFSKEGKGRG